MQKQDKRVEKLLSQSLILNKIQTSEKIKLCPVCFPLNRADIAPVLQVMAPLSLFLEITYTDFLCGNCDYFFLVLK